MSIIDEGPYNKRLISCSEVPETLSVLGTRFPDYFNKPCLWRPVREIIR